MKYIADLRAVLFDYDGVIVKADNNIDAWIRASHDKGLEIVANDWYKLEGLKPVEIAQALIRKYDVVGISSDDLVTEKNRQYEIIRNEKGNYAEIYEGVEKILSMLKKSGVKIGLVTGSILPRLNIIKDYFDVIVTADSVDEKGREIRGKPFPDPWLYAAEKLSIRSENCVGVENAVLGIKSVKSADIFCIALTTTLKKELLCQAGADLILKNQKSLMNYFKGYFG